MEANKYNLFTHYINKHDYGKAEKLLKEELVKDPDDDSLHAYLAIVYLDTQKIKQAKHEIEIALSANPENAYYHYLLYRYFLLVNQGFRARGAINQALRLDPEEPDYFGAVAALDIELHFYEAALRSARKGLQLDPTHVLCMNMQTQALKKLGRKEEAMRSLDDALKEHPENAFTHENAGWMYLNAGKFEKAEEHFLNSLRNNPSDTDAKRGYISALRGKIGWFGFLFRSTAGLNYFYTRYFFVLIIACGIISGITREYLQIKPGFVLIHVLSFFAFIIILPAYAQPLFDFFIIRKGRGKLIFEKNIIKQSYFAVFIVPVATLCMILALFIPEPSSFTGLFILSLIGLCQGILMPENAILKPVRLVFFAGLLIYGLVCIVFTAVEIKHDSVFGYMVIVIALPAINTYVSRLVK